MAESLDWTDPLPVRRVEPDATLLEAHAASPERRDWWLARLERCYALL